MTASGAFRSESARRAWVLFLAAFALVHGLYQAGRAFLHPKQGLDLAPAYVAGRMVAEGDLRVYDDPAVDARARTLGVHGPAGPGDPVLNFIYPPWVPGLYAPLSWLSWPAARRVWFLLSLGAALLSVLLLSRAAGRERVEQARLLGLGLLLSAFSFPLAYGLMTGQSNDLLLLLAAGGLLLLSRDRPFLAGLVLAPAALWKPFLCFPAFFLLARREGKALLGLLLGAAALFAASPGGREAWEAWGRQVSAHNAVTAVEPRNHGLSQAALVLAPSPESLPLVRGVLFGLAILLALAALLPRSRRGEPLYALQLGATLVLGVLLTPKAWEHYGVFLLPALVAAFALAAERGRAGALLALGAVAAVWGGLLEPREEYEALSGAGLELLLPLKAYAGLALLGVAAFLAWTARRKA
ncbi:MAG: DUF2029 domain-containing protein [Acidobacteria bacterium]|nr:MAG: DUF2029 domain-containing protein [Acidobacteriota bacterium]